MNAPEPVDEHDPGLTETRGGDHFADINAVDAPHLCGCLGLPGCHCSED